MMDEGNQQRAASMPAKPFVYKKKRRMAEFILYENIETFCQQAAREPRKETTAKSPQIGACGQTDNFHLMAESAQALGHNPVIEIAAGESVQAAVDNEADAHQRVVAL